MNARIATATATATATAIGLALSASFALAAQQPPTHNYPTQARVEYVMRCMNLHGGPSYDTMYACVCAVDRIADNIPYDEYVQAEMLGYLLSTPGERGGVFRDATPDSRARAKAFLNTVDEAERACFVKRS